MTHIDYRFAPCFSIFTKSPIFGVDAALNFEVFQVFDTQMDGTATLLAHHHLLARILHVGQGSFMPVPRLSFALYSASFTRS